MSLGIWYEMHQKLHWNQALMLTTKLAGVNDYWLKARMRPVRGRLLFQEDSIGRPKPEGHWTTWCTSLANNIDTYCAKFNCNGLGHLRTFCSCSCERTPRPVDGACYVFVL